MKNWKKILLSGLTASVAVVSGAIFVACGDKAVEYKFVTYDNNTLTVSGKKGTSVEFPDAPDREGYVFEGWYLDAEGSGSPVTSATFGNSVTYYAKWTQAYALTLELGGGRLEKSKFWLKEGTNIYSFLQDYTPVWDGYQFGYWVDREGDKISVNEKMTTKGCTLTAKYAAGYTINVELQNADLETYTATKDYQTGYAIIDEEFTPTVSIDGYVQSGDDEKTLLISEDRSENVFNFRFDRRKYSFVWSSNYPDGTPSVTEREKYAYESEVALPENTFSVNGYRFVGWATVPNGTYADVIKEATYTVKDDVLLYAVWNKGYTDMFSGEDIIYISPENAENATLVRGGAEIEGRYDARRNFYNFASETTSYVLRARINENGTFVYYTDRSGSYTLYQNGALNENITLVLSNLNDVEYYSREGDDKVAKTGTYTITEDGLYEATFEDGSSFVFTIRPASATNATSEFRIRGEEYTYDILARGGLYYPAIMFDGFGNAAVVNGPSQNPATYEYAVDGKAFTLKNTSGSMAICIFDYNGTKGYEYYTKALDREFQAENATLTLDGCVTAVYGSANKQFSGTYTTEESVFGGYVVTVETENETFVYHIYSEADGEAVAYRFEEKSAGYREYYYAPVSGNNLSAPYLVDNGDGTAALYEVHNRSLEKTSSGTLVKDTAGKYIYTVDENGIADWANIKATVLVVGFNVTSTQYNIYYWFSSTTDGETKDYTSVYTDKDGAVFTVATSSFATYTDKDGATVWGHYTDYTSYVRFTDSEYNSYYFILNKAQDGNNTFEVLTRSPLILTKRIGNQAFLKFTLTISGRVLEGDRDEAIYVEPGETEDAENVTYRGYYTLDTVEAFGGSASIFTFVSEERTFKFVVTSANNYNFFTTYELDEPITLASFTAINDSDAEDADSTLVLTDEKIDGNPVLTYTVDGQTYKGTFTSEEITAFGEYKAVVYTLTAGNETFRFTLQGSSYFRICADNAEYEAEDGSTLTLDGATHIARYIDAAGNYHDNYYLVTNNVLNENGIAVSMYVEEVFRYFDLDEENMTFSLRGLEAGGYLKIDNGMFGNELVTLDGYGNASLRKADSEETVSAMYSVENGLYTIEFTAGSYVGRLGSFTMSGTAYNAFLIEMVGVEGSYVDQADLSVLVLDDIGNAVKYNSFGQKETGRYVVLTDCLFYYENTDATNAALYTYSKDGKIVAADYNATYYADDFSSVVFYRNGVVRFNNNASAYFSYDEKENKIVVYTPDTSENANKYGFATREIELTDGTLVHTDANTGTERTYYLFDGKYVTFTDAEGNTLEFQPTGAPTFTVAAVYTKAGETEGKNYSVVLNYANGEARIILVDSKADYLNGSASRYSLTLNYTLDISFSGKDFTWNTEEYLYGLSAYDYTYLARLMSTGNADSQYYGLMNIVGELKNGEVNYAISGGFNFIEGTDGKPLSFTNGSLSKAGYYNQNYGSLFMSEFTGSDGETYHLRFYLAPNNTLRVYTFIVYALTRVTKTIDLGTDTVVYRGNYIYTTGFKLIKSVDEFGKEVEFEIGEEFFPVLKYKGEIVCGHSFQETADDEWLFVAREYYGSQNNYKEYYYYFNYTLDGELNISGGTVTKLATQGYKTEDGNTTAFVLYDVESGEISEVYGIIVGETEVRATACEKNADGSFTMTAENAVYKISFESVTDEEGKVTVIATVEEVPSEPDPVSPEGE